MTRKIDALVAEHVMGLIFNRHHWVNESKNTVARLGADPPEYSTDIAAAWEVVEKSEYLRIEFMGVRWVANLTDFDSDDRAADTAPMAICLAALKAKGVEVSDD